MLDSRTVPKLEVDMERAPLPDTATGTIRLVRENKGRGDVELNRERYRKTARS
jgi:hypothetical protein